MANFVVLYLFINLSSKTKSNLYEMYGKKVAKAVIILLVLINPKVKKGFSNFTLAHKTQECHSVL